jgi:YVTN family beta-propeller protein
MPDMMDRKKAALLLFCLAVTGSAVLGIDEVAARAAPAGIASRAAQKTHAEQSTGDPAQQETTLDFEEYRTRIEPIFLKKREGGVRCYDCHALIITRLRLAPLTSGNTSWTKEQSQKNFETVAKLVTPSEPLESRLLLHPLAKEAGGDPTHTGGKFWASQNDPEWQMLAAWVRHSSSYETASAKTAAEENSTSLDFDFFKTKVQPIFLKERPGHARCYGCHSLPSRDFHLETLAPGNEDWTDEQSRKNFQSALKQVVPGEPDASRLLMHALAPEAGGEAFHSGGRQFASPRDPDWQTIADWVRGVRATTVPAAKTKVEARIYVTDSAGDTVEVIDPATNKVVQIIHGIELPHGVNFSGDGAHVYVSNESESVLDVVDRKSGEILQKVALSGHPNNITVTKDGRNVLVGIRADPGAIDVIDGMSLKRIGTIPVHGSVHNIYVTPDGKYAVTGSIETKSATVVDLTNDQIAWVVQFDKGVRPMAFEANPDGSTKRIFVQLSELNGFAVVDFAKHAEVARIKLPDQPGGFGVAEGRLGTPSHGIGVSPDGKALWVNSTFANAVFKYSLPELKLVGYVALPEVHPLGQPATGAVPEWITFTPDGKLLYLSNSGARSVSAIDTATLQQVALIPVGEVPKRINTLVLR